MLPIEIAALAFGALLTLIGVFLFARMGAKGQNTIKFGKLELQLSGSALVIILVGALIFVLPFTNWLPEKGIVGEQEVRKRGAGVVAPDPGRERGIETNSESGTETSSGGMMPTGQARRLSEQERSEGKAELEQRIRKLEAQLQKERPPVKTARRPEQGFQGTWLGAGGVRWMISQTENMLSVTEMSPVGLTAVCEGEVEGRAAELDCETVMQTMGRATVRLDRSRNALSGSYTDHVLGFVTPLQFAREN